jgi:hypothetical protein
MRRKLDPMSQMHLFLPHDRFFFSQKKKAIPCQKKLLSMHELFSSPEKERNTWPSEIKLARLALAGTMSVLSLHRLAK